jgi:hypothetical protein
MRLYCAMTKCETRVHNMYRLYKKVGTKSKQRYCKKHADQLTTETYVEAEFIN